ncbi:MAG: hypothetical protein COX63_01820 [Candidatus Diapherotrites archaeon CG_4_10_14_0_2_um_filter_31_5]|nr:MAG: hypothetical protein COX63_01820 [Candidatus Diapherotrites archaeon CG_4_10_14_0_2_um_filter_31_5]
MDEETEMNYLSKLKDAIEKGQAKRYGTFVLVILTAVLLLNVIGGDPVGKAIQPKEKTCDEINGICSSETCAEGYTTKDNFCPNNQFCCKKS